MNRNMIKHLLFSLMFVCAVALKAATPITGDVIVNKGEVKELPAGSKITTLTIYGDQEGCGQVTVSSGIVTIDQIIYKYTVIPGEWFDVSFPETMDIERGSNFRDLGFRFRGDKYYEVKQFSSQERSNKENGWTLFSSRPRLEAFKGYKCRLMGSETTDPIEVSFTLNDLTLDTETSLRMLYLDLDMTNEEVGHEKVMYVSAKNVKSNRLKLNVTYSPTSSDEVPLNYKVALEESRLIQTLDKDGVRISLPNMEPAKVVFMNKRGTKVMKCVNYISPAKINISDLKKRTYQVIIQYGNATTVKTFKKK